MKQLKVLTADTPGLVVHQEAKPLEVVAELPKDKPKQPQPDHNAQAALVLVKMFESFFRLR